MSQADELLMNSLTEEENETGTYATTSDVEPHIIINSDRSIIVPTELKKVAVQFDHNVETVTFDCPRYWDELDMSTMKVYINYRRPDGKLGCYSADNVRVSDEDESVMCFDWTLSRNVTLVKGVLSFLICIKKVNAESGVEENHWNSELCNSMTISEGLECTEEVVEENTDVITQLLVRMDKVEENVEDLSLDMPLEVHLIELGFIGGGTEIVSEMTYSDIVSSMNSRPIIVHGMESYPVGTMLLLSSVDDDNNLIFSGLKNDSTIITLKLTPDDKWSVEERDVSEVLIVHAHIDENGTITKDKTYAEVKAAIDSGKIVKVRTRAESPDMIELLFVRVRATDEGIPLEFYHITGSDYCRVLWFKDESITFYTKHYLVSDDKNMIDNRITSLETDVGNIETALDSIIAIQNQLMGVSE